MRDSTYPVDAPVQQGLALPANSRDLLAMASFHILLAIVSPTSGLLLPGLLLRPAR
jgi:hypothetical protein